MGPDIELTEMEVVQRGTLQMDFYNKSDNEHFRVFVEPEKFFDMLGKSMQKNADEWQRKFDIAAQELSDDT